MKKRVVTEDQYPLPKGVFKLLTPEEKIIRLAAKKKYNESDKYTISDFTKKRYYVVLARSRESGTLYGFYDQHKNPISESKLLIYTTSLLSFKGSTFRLKALRRYPYSGHSNAEHNASRLRGMKGSKKFDIFVARVGSKNCPVKVKIKPELKNQARASFVVKD